MKVTRILAITLVLGMLLAVTPAKAVKPATNLASAQTVEWNLSAAVMPVPPYGSVDISGSDTASKLIINQPNGNTEVAITGVMNGLHPLTTYTVYLSNSYTPYVITGWDVSGSYTVGIELNDVIYPEPMVLTQSGNQITGVSLGGSPSPYPQFTITGGSVSGSDITITANLGGLVVQMVGTIAADGSMSGDWSDIAGGTRVGTWATTSGHASVTHTGSTGWPGLFTSSIQPFTFTTNEVGSGSFHLNLKEDLGLTGEKTMSIWINEGGTMLISDNFTVVFE